MISNKTTTTKSSVTTTDNTSAQTAQTAESSSAMNTGSATASTQATTVILDNTKPPVINEVSAANIENYASIDTSQISSFFARPVHIQEITWSIGSSPNVTINPWDLWFNHPSIQIKLANYELCRFNLNLIFQINGSPFHFGRMIAAYSPFEIYGRGPAVPGIESDKMRLSQRSPIVYLDPVMQDSVGMKLPFFYPNDYLRVDNSTINIGLVELFEFVALDVASNTGSENLNISIFAFASEMELTIPTPYDFTAQMPDMNSSNEYKTDGIISAPATAIANMASSIENVPIIGRYATAAKTAATAVGSIAKLFGFSKPVNVQPIALMKRDIYVESANTSGLATINKLSLDPKQEVSISPKDVGLDSSHDCMTIQHMVERPSYLFSIPWTEASYPGQILASVSVSPHYAITTTTASNDGIQMSSLAYATIPFHYWGGTIVYNLSIVASQYHRGRIKVTWVPAGKSYSEIEINDYNTSYSCILDLNSNRDVDIAIAMVADVPYLTLDSPMNSSWNVNGTVITSDVNHHNGTLVFSVVNELTSPDSVSPVSVIVTARAGKNFDVFGFKDQTSSDVAISRFSDTLDPPDLYSTPTPVTYALQMDFGMSINNPGETKVIDLITEDSNIDYSKRALINHGDPIKSYRNLLHRWNQVEFYASTRVAVDDTVVLNKTKIFRKNFPGFTGRNNGGYVELNGVGMNYNKTTLLAYLKLSYVAWKGGLRWRYHSLKLTPNGDRVDIPTMMYIERSSTQPNDPPKDWDYFDSIGTKVPLAAQFTAFTNLLPTLSSGAHFTDPNQQNAVEVELPFYNNKKFCICNEDNFRGTNFDGSWTQNHAMTMVTTNYGSVTESTVNWASYVSTGDDFQFHWYVGAPPLYIMD